MGPIALFDKSFLQSLSVDEAVWFDKFFYVNIVPPFLLETLADLAKDLSRKTRRNTTDPEREVRALALKTPELGSAANAFHVRACIANLMGSPVAMTGQILVAGAKRAQAELGVVAVQEYPEEMEALNRWKGGRFSEVEKLVASAWRSAMAPLDRADVLSSLEAMGFAPKLCRSIDDVKKMASDAVRDPKGSGRAMELAVSFCGITDSRMIPLYARWAKAGRPVLAEYAPYAAFVTSVHLFFHIAVASGKLSGERASNQIDIAYVFYLPFCHVFVSSDKLHRSCASLFMRPEQVFVWGEDLKADLCALNTYYSDFPTEEKEKGLFALTDSPPRDVHSTVADLWDRFLPAWRGMGSTIGPAAKDDRAVSQIREAVNLAAALTEGLREPMAEADAMVMTHKVHARRGSWWQVSPELRNPKQVNGELT